MSFSVTAKCLDICITGVAFIEDGYITWVLLYIVLSGLFTMTKSGFSVMGRIFGGGTVIDECQGRSQWISMELLISEQREWYILREDTVVSSGISLLRKHSWISTQYVPQNFLATPEIYNNHFCRTSTCN